MAVVTLYLAVTFASLPDCHWRELLTFSRKAGNDEKTHLGIPSTTLSRPIKYCKQGKGHRKRKAQQDTVSFQSKKVPLQGLEPWSPA